MADYIITSSRWIPALAIAEELDCDVVFRVYVAKGLCVPWLETQESAGERYKKLRRQYGKENIKVSRADRTA